MLLEGLNEIQENVSRLRAQSIHNLRQAGFLSELETYSVLICDLKNHNDMRFCQISPMLSKV